MKLSHAGVIIGAVLVILLVLAAIFADIVSGHDPIEQNIQNVLESPSSQHPLGTDRLGRDILSRVVYGLRTNLGVGALAMLIALVAGVFLGGVGALLELVAGSPGKAINNIVTIFARFLSAGPAILLLLVIAAVRVGGTVAVAVGIALVLIPGFIRVVGGAVLCRKDISAFESIGMIVAKASLNMALAVLLYSILGFIGLGMQPPAPELGVLVAEGRNFLRDMANAVVYPGLVLAVTVLSFNILGESLNSLLIRTKI